MVWKKNAVPGGKDDRARHSGESWQEHALLRPCPALNPFSPAGTGHEAQSFFFLDRRAKTATFFCAARLVPEKEETL